MKDIEDWLAATLYFRRDLGLILVYQAVFAALILGGVV